MGENTQQPNTIRRHSTIKQYRLSDAMIAALDTGRSDSGTANVLGRSGTLAALVERGLITTGRTHKWTALGFGVAARVLSGRVPTWAEGMAYADKLHAEQQRAEDAERYDPGPTVLGANGWPVPVAAPDIDIEAQAEAAAREVTATGGGLGEWARRQQLAGRPLRTQADRTTEAAPATLLSRERIEPGDLVTVDGADRRVWRVESLDDGRGTKSGEPYASMTHVSGTRTAVPVKRLTHTTAGEIMGRPAPRFAVGDRVTIPDRDERVWRIASIIPGDPDGRPVPVKPWASLTHEASRYETVTTTANLDRLAPAAPGSEYATRPIPDGHAGFRRGESVTVAQGDDRVWRIDDLRETFAGERFATMTHTGRSPLDVSHTAVPLGRLLRALPSATSQPATSQIEQQLADLAELIRNVRQVDPDLSRAVERAKYDALRAVLRVLTGWIEGAREANRRLGYRDEDRPAGVTVFAPEDIRRMVNDAARELGIREPWAPEAKS